MKKFIALTAAILMTLNLVACSEAEVDETDETDNNTTTTTTTVTTTTTTTTTTSATTTENSNGEKPASSTTKQEEVVPDEEKTNLPEIELVNKELNWFAHYNLVPHPDAMPVAELQMFEEVYDGEVVETVVDWNSRYNELAMLVLTGKSPDIFPADDMDAFPKGAIREMFQPVNEYVDYKDALWVDVSSAADSFSINDKRYVAVTDVLPSAVCVYNRDEIINNGFDDPMNLFEEGAWTLDSFYEMCKLHEYKSICGWWYPDAIQQTCGKPLLGMDENGKLVNNMYNSDVMTVEKYMGKLAADGDEYRSTNEYDTIEDFMNSNCLFFPVGFWAIEDACDFDFGTENISFVPMPHNTLNGNNPYYVGAKIEGYFLCSGAPNPDAFKAFVSCARACAIDETVQKEKDNYRKEVCGWNDEMIEMYHTVKDMALENPVFELYGGVSDDLTTTYQQIVVSMMWGYFDTEKTWSDVVDEYRGTVDWLIGEANQAMS